MSTRVPEPACVRLIAPPITLLKCVPCVTVSVQLKASVPPAEPVITLVVANAPVVPALPICSVPALILVVPVSVLLPESVSVPTPDLMRPKPPPIGPPTLSVAAFTVTIGVAPSVTALVPKSSLLGPG